VNFQGVFDVLYPKATNRSIEGNKMPFTNQVGLRSGEAEHPPSELKTIVMGLHWDPLDDGIAGQPADLDAVCVVFDLQDQVTDVIHPNRPRNADGSIIHTGDSRTGASVWDDERIFVFLEALPETVSKLAFVVVNPTGRPFHDISGASCHISDHANETELIRVDLTAITGQTSHTVAIVYRCPAGWRISVEVPAAIQSLLAGSQLQMMKTMR
jgi:tellurium resistance protein TerD